VILPYTEQGQNMAKNTPMLVWNQLPRGMLLPISDLKQACLYPAQFVRYYLFIA